MKKITVNYDDMLRCMKSPVDWFSMMADSNTLLEEHILETSFKYITLFIKTYRGNYKRTPLNFLVHYNTDIKTKVKLLQFNITYTKKRVICYAMISNSVKIPIYYFSNINDNITNINYSFYAVGRESPYLKLGFTKKTNFNNKQLYKLVSHYSNGNLTFFYEDYNKDKMIYTIMYKNDMNFYIKNIIRNSTVYNEPFVIIIDDGAIKYAVIHDFGVTLPPPMIESAALFVDSDKENIGILMKLAGITSPMFSIESFYLCLKDIKKYTKVSF